VDISESSPFETLVLSKINDSICWEWISTLPLRELVAESLLEELTAPVLVTSKRFLRKKPSSGTRKSMKVLF